MTLLHDTSSQPLRDLLEACERGRVLASGLRDEARLRIVFADIEGCGRDLEEAAIAALRLREEEG